MTADEDLKYFRTSKQGKVGMKKIDLVNAESRRRQSKFLMDNPTFKMKATHKFTENSEALANLAKNSLYFKTKTLRSNNNSTTRSFNTMRSPGQSKQGPFSESDDFKTLSDKIVGNAGSFGH